jgi:LPS-assembly protein
VKWRRFSRAAGLACGAGLAVLLGRGPQALGQPPEATSEDEIVIDAESVSYDKRDDSVEASGDVVIRRGDTTLRADDVRFNRRTSEAAALGDAVLTSPDAEIRAREMYLNLENETGELREADIYSDSLGFSLSGKRIEKGAGHTYRIENGRFTTCHCVEGPPSWTIAGDSLDVELDGYGQLEGGTFEILDVPVLWLPRAAFPVFRERQSGFLFPRLGVSNRRGFQILQPYFWDISKSQDATISFDLETSLRVGLVGEYRYAFSQDTNGQFQVGYFNDAFGGRDTDDVTLPPGADTSIPDNRWGVIGDHEQRFGTTEGFVHLLLVGDDLFLREMNTFSNTERQEVDLRTRPFTESSMGFVQSWSRVVLIGQATYYQDLVGPAVELAPPPPQPPTPTFATAPIPPPSTPTPTPVQFVERESLVIQRAPEAFLFAQKQFGWGLMGGFTGSGTNFVRGRGFAGFRGDLRPAATLRLPLGRSFNGTVQAAFRETAYALTENEMAGGFSGQNLNDPTIILPSTSSREIFEVRADLRTQVARVFEFPHFGLDKLKHTIEPQVEYLYIPPVGQADLPVFDGIDRINKRSLFTYGLVTRLLGRSSADSDGERGDVFELTRLSIAQSYDFIRDIPPTMMVEPGDPVPVESGDHFSDIDVALRVNPSAITSVRTYATYDTSEGNLSSAVVGVRLREPARIFDQQVRPRLLTRASLTVDYRFITDSILQLLDSSVAVPITDRIAVLYAMRYDIDEGSFLENYVGLQLFSSCDCWALNLGVIDTSNPNEVQVQAQFTLAGLGSSTVGGLGSY